MGTLLPNSGQKVGRDLARTAGHRLPVIEPATPSCVAFARDVDLGVTELEGDPTDRNPTGEELAGEGVPEILQLHVPHPGPPTHPTPRPLAPAAVGIAPTPKVRPVDPVEDARFGGCQRRVFREASLSKFEEGAP